MTIEHKVDTLFGDGRDDDDERDMPLTLNDVKRRMNAKKTAPMK